MDRGGKSIHVGTALFTSRGRHFATEFQYSPGYVSDPAAYPIDPALPLTARVVSVSGLPGAFRDSAPDLWGRNLIDREHRASGSDRSLNEADYLLRSSDFAREGNLRYQIGGRFVDDTNEIPRLVDLPVLLRESDRVVHGGDALTAVKHLLAAGSSTLGGARPKASVVDGGHLFVAKFPSPTDEFDVIRWEKTALDLAFRAGIRVPENRLIDIAGRPVLLQRRFDRNGARRLGYISAMTLLEAKPGEDVDYADFPDYIAPNGAEVNEQLAEMWRRIAFSVLIHNTDDHLRNTGFLRSTRGWKLAPAFDINPSPDPAQHRITAILGVTAGSDELPAVLGIAPRYRLDNAQAATMLAEVSEALRDWRTVARANGIQEPEIARFADVFDRP